MEELIIDNVNYQLDKRIIRGLENNNSLNLLLLLNKYSEYAIEHELTSDIPVINKLVYKIKHNCLCS